MEQAFRESRERMRNRLEKKIKEEKKRQQKEFICFFIVLAFILSMLTYALGKMNEDFIEKCTAQGYSETYCQVHN